MNIKWTRNELGDYTATVNGHSVTLQRLTLWGRTNGWGIEIDGRQIDQVPKLARAKYAALYHATKLHYGASA